ncbi:TolC family protein [Asticcacaulis sp. AC402]|uniref:TolC family protein n=1 Tax=Asticcacaulis sp. AC402 TaxID=1282361 RepID=UPI0003C40EF2|nr:TolC family protein [Asticcacaulis sp. AC402]ESQ76981.1 hypothetical protein ABAC402_02600 [Asticcacaulis sp. AC402]
MNRWVLVCLAGLILAPLTAMAQTCPSLHTAVAQAAGHDARIRVADAQSSRAQAQYQQARSPLFPQVDSFARAGVGDGALADNQVDNRVGIQASQNLIDLALGGAITAARAEADAAQAETVRTRRDIARETATAYAAVAHHQARLAVLRAYAERLDSHAPRRAESFAIGAMTREDVEAWSTERARAHSAVIEETGALAAAQTALDHLTGASTCVDAASLDTDLMARRAADDGQYLAAVVTDNPKRVQASARISQAEGQVRETRRARWPRLVLSGFYAQDFDSMSETWRQRDRIGLDLRLPILSGGRYRAELASSRAGLEVAQAQHDKTLSDLDAYLGNTLTQIDLGQQKHSRLVELRDGKLRVRDALDAALKISAATLDEADRAQADYVAAALGEIDARHELTQVWIGLLTEAGRL